MSSDRADLARPSESADSYPTNLSADIRSLVTEPFPVTFRAFGLSRFVAAGISLLLEFRQLWRRPTGYALCAELLGSLTILTWRQIAMYTDVETPGRLQPLLESQCETGRPSLR